MSASLQGRHVAVTGASRGIGAAIARVLAAEGADVTLLGRDASALQAVAGALPGGGKRHVAVADIADRAAVQGAFAQATAALGPFYALVNNAGQGVGRAFEKIDDALWQQMLSVNLTGTFHCIQAALPTLLQAATPACPARVVNVASTAGLQGYPQVSAYVAAKHGVIGLTRSLALELAKRHITVNAVCPGYTETDIAAQAIASLKEKTGRTEEQARQMLVARNPQQRMIQPDEVAATVLWLLSAGSASINGQAIAIDGGELAG